MSILRRHARPNPQTLTRRYNTRLSEEDAEQFEEICRKYNLTPSEAIRLLIVEEIKRVRDEKQTNADEEETMSRGMRTIADRELTYVSKPAKTKKSTAARGGRFTTTQWQVGKATACPICRDWHSTVNFSRHAKVVHGMTTKEIFQDEERQRIADEMVKQKTTGF